MYEITYKRYRSIHMHIYIYICYIYIYRGIHIYNIGCSIQVHIYIDYAIKKIMGNDMIYAYNAYSLLWI